APRGSAGSRAGQGRSEPGAGTAGHRAAQAAPGQDPGKPVRGGGARAHPGPHRSAPALRGGCEGQVRPSRASRWPRTWGALVALALLSGVTGCDDLLSESKPADTADLPPGAV